jgi:hypothetical protein
MSITIIPLSEADHAGVLQLLATFWQRGWTETLMEDYFAWRYGSRGEGETLVACDRGRSVGILDSFVRRYWIDGRQELVRETCDWLTEPVVHWFAETVPVAVRAEFDRYIGAGDLKQTIERLQRLQSESDAHGGFVGMYL